MSLLVEGRLSIRSYESKSGEKHKAAEVVISFMQMLNRTASNNTDTETYAETGDELESSPQ
jgi:single-stranded DNA-binding protein